MDNKEEFILLTVKEAAQKLGMSRQSVMRRIKDGSLKAIKISGKKKGNRYRIEGNELLQFLKRNKTN